MEPALGLLRAPPGQGTARAGCRTEGVAAMAAEVAAALAASVAAATVVLELRGRRRRRAATAVGKLRANEAMGTRAAEALPLALTAALATAKRKRSTGRKNRLAAAAAVGLVKGGYQLTGSP